MTLDLVLRLEAELLFPIELLVSIRAFFKLPEGTQLLAKGFLIADTGSGRYHLCGDMPLWVSSTSHRVDLGKHPGQ